MADKRGATETPAVIWKILGQKKAVDLDEFIRESASQGQAVHVGTDSLQVQTYTQFVTVVIVLSPSKGGRVLYTRELVPRIDSLRQRLLAEVWRSLEVALSIQARVRGSLHIHIDANPTERYLSSKYLKELIGMVVGNGFQAVVKPDAFAASHAADYIVRHHGKLPGIERGADRKREAWQESRKKKARGRA